jgi:hypothetical protein
MLRPTGPIGHNMYVKAAYVSAYAAKTRHLITISFLAVDCKHRRHSRWTVFPRLPGFSPVALHILNRARLAGAVPPSRVVSVPVNVWRRSGLDCPMQHGAKTTPHEVKLVRYQLPVVLPPEVLVVQSVVGVEQAQVFRQMSWRWEVVDENVRMRRKLAGVVIRMCSHHDRYNIISASTHVKATNLRKMTVVCCIN